MGAFAVYTFISGIVLQAAYLIYKWLLSGERQPAFNRGILIGIYALSFLFSSLFLLQNFNRRLSRV